VDEAARAAPPNGREAVAWPDLGRRSAAEGLAAFALVFAGCGAVVTNSEYDSALGAVGVSVVFRLVIMVMVYATGHLSGAHINPAVTVAFTLSRHLPGRDAAAYIVAQVLGATAGALILLAVWPDQPGNLGAPPSRASPLAARSSTRSS
jgi:aquaporin NIP